jgi:protoheme IX farnesyltransferase
MRRFRVLAVAATVATFLLVGIGGLVRATGSGLGCPGWPRCWGRWWPPSHLDPTRFSAADVAAYSYHHAIIEWTHRLVAAAAITLVIAVAIAALIWLRDNPRIMWAALGTAILILVQAALGAIVVKEETAAWLVAVHFGTAMLLVGALVFIVVSTFDLTPGGRWPPVDRGFATLTRVTAASTFVLLLVGAYVRATNATLVFSDWPLMDGRLVPTLGGVATAQFTHRLLAAAVGLLIAWVAIKAWTSQRRVKPVVVLSTLALVLVVIQIAAGGAIVLTKEATWAIVTHEFVSSLVWGSVAALMLVAGALAVGEPMRDTVVAQAGKGEPTGGVMLAVSAYVALMKPRIIELLLVTTVPAMILAYGGIPPIGLLIATLVGGTLAAGSANAINCYIDRDIDGVMRRTRRRPVPAHRVTPERALTFGYILGVISFYFLSITVNVEAAGLSMLAIGFYVFVYTLWLKRSTSQNIVIGGAAGAVPVLVGWAAVTQHVGVAALIMFAIVFVWTPPHFWALALHYKNDYAAARVPMLPVVKGLDETLRQILLYSIALVPVTLLLIPFAHLGPIYLVSAIVLGGIFIGRAARMRRNYVPQRAVALFHYSIAYLTLLFASVAADKMLGGSAMFASILRG